MQNNSRDLDEIYPGTLYEKLIIEYYYNIFQNDAIMPSFLFD